MAQKLGMDAKDRSILDALRKDARATVRDIAKGTALRPSTVHQRMQTLKREGIIEKYTIKLNNAAVGESFIVFLLVKTEGELDNRIFSSSHVKEVFGITGEYDLLLKLKFSNIEQFNTFIIRFRKNTQIKNTLTMVATINLKEEI